MITREFEKGTELCTVDYGGLKRSFLTAHALPGHGPLLSDLLPAIGNNRALTVFSQRVFGGFRYYDEVLKAQGRFSCPVTWLQGDACTGKELSGMQFCALSGVEVRPLELDGKTVGIVYEDEFAEYCFLAGIIADDLKAGREQQTRAVFEKIERALQQAGMEFTDVFRTWIYLDRLLEWYDEFNVVRTDFFNERKVFDHMVPASTGIGAGNHAGAACLIDAYAIKPKSDVIKISPVASPLQCPAWDYKSSFARAVEVEYPALRELYISGTASIHPGGETAYIGDVRRQIELTFDVVSAILESRGMQWDDMVRGIAYFKTLHDVPVYEEVCRARGLGRMPVALAHADVCRHDLLFEIELDAMRAG